MQRQDYPRPDAVRPRLKSLNGVWEFAKGELPEAKPELVFDEKINVPFPSGSEMSGQTEPSASVRYRKRFELTAFECSGTVLLNFLNVDGAFGVVLNGVNVFSGIKGGASAHFDVSRIVREGVNELTVFSAASPSTRGIYGGVWLEFAAKSYFSFIRANAVYASKAIYIQGAVAGATEDYKILVELASGGKQIFRREYKALPSFTLHVPLERLPDMWTASHPALYDVRLTLITPGGGMADMLYTYTAFREIDVLDGKIYINGRRTFFEAVLDPMYYPGSGSTPPDSDRIAKDLAFASLAGFNSVIFDSYPTPAHLYIADKLGLFAIVKLKNIVPSDENYRELIMRDYGHPCIVIWEAEPQNYDAATQRSVYNDLKNTDPKRIVTFPSAKRIYATDLYSFDCDEKDIAMYLQLRFNRAPMSEKEEMRLKKNDPAALSFEKLKSLPAFYTGLKSGLNMSDAVKEAAYKAKYSRVYSALFENASGMEVYSLYDAPDRFDGLMSAEREYKLSSPKRDA